MIELYIDVKIQGETQRPRMKMKTVPLARLLADNACWQALKIVETEATRKAEVLKQRRIHRFEEPTGALVV